jgi:hypothetical protein
MAAWSFSEVIYRCLLCRSRIGLDFLSAAAGDSVGSVCALPIPRTSPSRASYHSRTFDGGKKGRNAPAEVRKREEKEEKRVFSQRPKAYSSLFLLSLLFEVVSAFFFFLSLLRQTIKGTIQIKSRNGSLPSFTSSFTTPKKREAKEGEMEGYTTFRHFVSLSKERCGVSWRNFTLEDKLVRKNTSYHFPPLRSQSAAFLPYLSRRLPPPSPL